MSKPLQRRRPPLTRIPGVWALLATNVLIVGALVSATALGLRSSRASEDARARQAVENLARGLAAEVRSELRQVDNALATVARVAERNGMSTRAGLRAVQDVLFDQAALLPHVSAMRIADRKGDVIVGASDARLNVGDRDYFIAASNSDQAVVSEPIRDRMSGRWGIVLARRIRNADGSLAGVVHAGVTSEHLSGLFRKAAIGSGGAISLRSSTLRLVARHTPGEPDPTRGLGSSTVSADFSRSIAANPAQGWFLTTTALDRVERISAYERLPDYGLVMLAGWSTEDYLVPWRREALAETTLLSIAIVAVVSMSALLFHRHRRERAARVEIDRLAREQRVMLDNDLVGMAKVRNRVNVWKNRALDTIFGYEHDELLDAPARLLYLDDASYDRVGTVGYAALRAGQRYRTQLQMRRRDGSAVWIDLTGVGITPDESLWLLVDITALKDSEAHARHLALHDALTGLPNRLQFSDRLAYILASAQRSGAMTAVCCVDLDGFKAVNDRWGHAAGDSVLRAVASRLREQVRGHDVVARLGGDEFAIVLARLSDFDEAQAVLERMLAEIARPILVAEGVETQVGASIGIAAVDGADEATLLQRADAAMYASKRLGRNRISRWTQALDAGVPATH